MTAAVRFGLVAAALLAAGCAAGDDVAVVRAPAATTASAPAATSEPTTASTDAPPGASALSTVPATEPPPTEPTSTGAPDVAPTPDAPPPPTDEVVDTTSPPVDDAGTTGARSCVAALPVDRQAALVVWPAVYSSDWSSAVATVGRLQLGGVVLMRPRGWTVDEVGRRLAELEQQAELGLLVATDEEGGDVQRLAIAGELPSQQAVSETLTVDAARDLVASHAAVIAGLGIDVVLGPVVDVVPPDGVVALTRSRFFTGGPDVVAAYAAAYADGWESAGLLPVLKHYPGHGAATADTHVSGALTPPLAQLAGWDLRPYVALAQRSPAVMVGHLTVPDLTSDAPATRSPAAIAYLRDVLGYRDALVISDALGMGAVGLPVAEATVRALAAGIDVAIFTDLSQTAAAVDAIVAAVGSGAVPGARLEDAATRVMERLIADGQGC